MERSGWLLRVCGWALVLASLVACIRVDTVVRLRPDGSGTIEETILLRRDVVRQVLGAPPGSESKPLSDSLIDERQLRQRALAMGPEVMLLSVEPLSDELSEGVRAVYAFRDINRLHFGQEVIAGPTPGLGPPPPGAFCPLWRSEGNLTFHLRPGNPATLAIEVPPCEGPPLPQAGALGAMPVAPPAPPPPMVPPPPAAAVSEEALLAQARQFLPGMGFRLTLEVEGTILQTDASFRDGNRIVLVDMDLGRLLEDDERLRAIMAGAADTMRGARTLMQDVPGARIETRPEIRVVFAPPR